MSRFTNTNVKLTLSDLRSKIRNGVVRVNYRENILRNNVAIAFGIDADDFNTDNFNPQTYRRFGKLFAVPMRPTLFGTLPDEMLWPTQDETATALQNFINRRADPWSHVRASPVDVVVEKLTTDVPQFPESV